MSECSIKNCYKQVVGNNLCDKHYRRFRKWGDPEKCLKGISLSNYYFWKNVHKTDTCWIWTGSKTHHGYGRIGFRRKRVLAHRLSWQLAGRTLERGMVLDHLCRNPLCVNPEHLEQVTQYENVHRGSRYYPELSNVGSYQWQEQSRINHLVKESQTNL
jgi:hypothetical protein